MKKVITFCKDVHARKESQESKLLVQLPIRGFFLNTKLKGFAAVFHHKKCFTFFFTNFFKTCIFSHSKNILTIWGSQSDFSDLRVAKNDQKNFTKSLYIVLSPRCVCGGGVSGVISLIGVIPWYFDTWILYYNSTVKLYCLLMATFSLSLYVIKI